AVLPTSISMTVISPGVTETSRGSSSVRTSDPDAALDGHHHRARRCRLDDELVAGCGGDHEAAGRVDPCRAAGRDDWDTDRGGVVDLTRHPPPRERFVAAAVDAGDAELDGLDGWPGRREHARVDRRHDRHGQAG